MKLTMSDIEHSLVCTYGDEGQEAADEIRKWKGLLNYYRDHGTTEPMRNGFPVPVSARLADQPADLCTSS